jgi:SPP1 family predicted phage head-tail adaptor
VIAAGQLSERITLQRPDVSSRDVMGGEVVAWTSVAEVWAKAVPATGREIFRADQVHAEKTVSFVIRRRTDVTAAWRLLWRGETYDIKHVLPSGHGLEETLELVGITGVRDG